MHEPVLVEEILEVFKDQKIRIFVDGTVGLGGHAKHILKNHPEIEEYIGIDQDEKALQMAEKNLCRWKDKVSFFYENFKDLDKVLKGRNVDGFLFDIGISSMQLEKEERGFSFQKEGPLDMRMDVNNLLKAEDVVNSFSKKDLEEIFKKYAEEPKWKKAALAIIKNRPIFSTKKLAEILRKVCQRKRGIHPATRCFQGIRIFVNKELEALEIGLKKALTYLSLNRRMAVISFHSLEDRIVKNFFREEKKKKTVDLLFKKPQTASLKEIRKNRRARSAKLRAVEKIL